jgi:hypothetical protein
MLTLTEFEIATTYEAQASALRRSFRMSEEALKAKSALEKARTVATLDGRIEGKNEAQREAAARLLLAQEYSDLESAEWHARLARHDLELTHLTVEELRLRLRLAELLAQRQGEAA